MSIRLQYRPEIDGLRAIAVVAVVFFHAYPEFVRGGFIGVDVFFVISGYLISGIIFNEVASNTFTLANFYSRRIRRLFPALIFVVSTVLIISWFTLIPDSFANLGKQALASSAFVANFYFWQQSGYFSPTASTLPLLHLWSLGVEEQFYIFWPVTVLLLPAYRKYRTVIVTVGLLSFSLAIFLAHHRDFSFYLPFTRAWELMAGAFLALRERENSNSKIKNANLYVGAGILLILASCLIFDQKMTYPSWRAALPVLGSMLIIAFGISSNLATNLLSNRSAMLIGKISYPLYLWHWPVLVLAAEVKFLPLTLLERGLVIAVSALLALVTYKFIELPIRSWAVTSRKVGRLAGGLGAIAIVGCAVVYYKGVPSRFPDDIFISNLERPFEMRINTCLIDLKTQSEFSEECIEHNRPMLAIWGDSTAGSLMSGLRTLQLRQSFGIVQTTASSCMPLLSGPISLACQENNQRINQKLSALKPDIVLLHASGPLNKETMQGWTETLTAIKAFGAKAIVLGPVPFWKRGLPEQAVSYYITHRSILPERSNILVSNLWDEERAQGFFSRLGAEYISTWNIFCNSIGCLTRVNGVSPTTIDKVHLTSESSKFLINSISDDIFNALLHRREPS